VLALAVSCRSVGPIGKQNFAHRYSPGFPVSVQHRIFDSGSDYSIFIEISLKKLSGIPDARIIWDKYQFGYLLFRDYDSRKVLSADSLGPDDRLSPSVNPLVLFVKIPKSGKNRLLTLWVKEKPGTETLYFDIPILEEETGMYDFCLFGKNGRLPVFSPFIHSGDTVVMRQNVQDEQVPPLEFYPFNNSIALPPMASLATSGQDFGSSYEVKYHVNQPLVFRNEGYYFLRTGKEGGGYGFIVTQPFFPHVTNAAELADPMVYISTREERRNLLEASNQKKVLDQFWLNANPQKETARKLIKMYFENIEAGNQYFSGHKAGWKTDRGMVYAIYGPPLMVNRDFDTEVWEYERTGSEEGGMFFFSRKKNENNPNVWELKRNEAYDRVWYGMVELWRKGVINR
jgi:GWxTD domain-containing protein